MREDIAKKLCERPRYGGGGKYQLKSDRRRGNNPRNYDSLPKKESMRAVNIRGYNGKYLNEFFPPLLGFLRKNVNRPWDKVYSEVCKHLNPSSTTQKHVFDHLLKHFVTLKPMYKEGSNVPYEVGWGGLREISGHYYVDKHGLLKAADTPKARKRWEKIRKARYEAYHNSRRPISGLEDYRRLDGIWYRILYRNLHVGESGYDVILRKEFVIGRYTNHTLDQENGVATTLTGEQLFGGRCRLAVAKRQISKKEIARHKLNSV